MIKGFYIDNIKSLVDVRLPAPHRYAEFQRLQTGALHVSPKRGVASVATTNTRITQGLRLPKD
ncbi:hypothetical protein J7E49_09225 [Variovorax paradoxus]|nr:hypothetical protein [Variovorax paradoxus]